MGNRFLVAAMAMVAALQTAGSAPDRMIAPRLTMSEAKPVSAGRAGYSRGPALAFGGGKYLLVYQDGYSGIGGDGNILGLFLDARGEPLGKPLEICVAKGVQDSPAVAACATGFLVAWSDFRSERDCDVYAALVAGDGKVGSELVIAGGAGQPGGQCAPAVTWNGKEAFVVWQDHRSGKQFAVFGARVSSEGRLLDGGGVCLMQEGTDPRVASSGGRCFVTTGVAGCVVDDEGKAGNAAVLWSEGKGSGASCLVSAYGKALEIVNLSPRPDPWGWGGNGSIMGLTFNADGTCPEDKAAEHRWGAAAAARADRVAKGVIEAARWRNCAGWPQGRPGGFKGSHDGMWPSGQPAAAFNGRSLLVAWPTAHFIDTLRLSNRDIHLKRVVDGWYGIDEPALKVVDGPTEEVNPVLAADGAGGAILAWERQSPQGGVLVEYAVLREEADTQPPSIDYIQKMTDSRMIIGFDEPIEAASVKDGSVTIEDAVVKAVAYNTEGPALGREIIVETDPLVVGKSYAIKLTRLADMFGNAARGEAFAYLARPGLAQRTPFVSRWLTIGTWPANYDMDYVRAAECWPSPGDTVKGPDEKDLMRHMTAFIAPEKYREATREPVEVAVPRDFAGDKTWKESVPRWANTVLDFIHSGYRKTCFALAYAHTYVWSDTEREVMVRIDSNAGHRAWLNGQIISDEPLGPKLISRAMHDRTNEVMARLNKGWNRLLIGVDTYVFTWGLAAQITDLNRQPIRDLTYQLEKPNP
jgi:hypothetical protein